MKKLFKNYFEKKDQKLKELTIEQKIELLRLNNKNPASIFYNWTFLFLILGSLFILVGVSIYLPFLNNYSYETAFNITKELYNAANKSMIVAFLFYASGVVSSLIFHFKKKKVVN